MKKYLLLISILSLLSTGFSQNKKSWKLFPSKTDTVLATDTVYTVVKAKKKGTVKVSKDKRIDKVSKDIAGDVNQPKIKGFRIQIISSSNKSIVDGERGKFLSSFSGCKTFIDYKNPNFRLRVGNFRTMLDAQKFQNKIKSMFPNTLIISDLIDLPNLD